MNLYVKIRKKYWVIIKQILKNLRTKITKSKMLVQSKKKCLENFVKTMEIVKTMINFISSLNMIHLMKILVT